MKIHRALVVYKKSNYEIYFLENRDAHLKAFLEKDAALRRQFLRSHEAHRAALDEVRRMLRCLGIRSMAILRGRDTDHDAHDLVIAVGGDGTFLEAARKIRKTVLLGVNSDPANSVGFLCAADRTSFSKVMKDVLSGKAKVGELNRLSLKLNGRPLGADVLNDLLVCHANPAAVTQYRLKIGKRQEEHRNSGLWISTAAGSTGAISSAGGRVMDKRSREIQYAPRELYRLPHSRYRLTGGILKPGGVIAVTALKPEMRICVDGAHLRFRMEYGDKLVVTNSKQPLRTVLS